MYLLCIQGKKGTDKLIVLLSSVLMIRFLRRKGSHLKRSKLSLKNEEEKARNKFLSPKLSKVNYYYYVIFTLTKEAFLPRLPCYYSRRTLSNSASNFYVMK